MGKRNSNLGRKEGRQGGREEKREGRRKEHGACKKRTLTLTK
jgi:hypothetical protein